MGCGNRCIHCSKEIQIGSPVWLLRFKNVNDINLLVFNLSVTWMGGFHLFADVAKYGQTNNRLEERSGDSKPNEGMNTQPVRDNANVFQSFNSYAKAVLGNKSVGVSANNDASNTGEKPVGCRILGKVKVLSVITDLLKYMSSEGFVDVGLRYVGDVGFGWNLILRIRCVWIDLVGLPLASWDPKVYKKFGGRWEVVCLLIWSTTDHCLMGRKDDEGPSLKGGPEHEEPLDVDNCDSVSSKDDNNDSDSSSEIISDSVLNNDGCVKDCMEKNLDDDVEKDIEDCSKNVTEKCGVVNNNMSNNVEGEILEDHFDGDHRNDTIEDNMDVNPSTNVYLDVNQNTSIPDVVEDLSSLDRSSDKAQRLAHHNNGLDDLDISLHNRLLHQDKCWVRPVKAAVNDSSIVSPSTPQGTVLNLAEEFCSTWLDYVDPLITDELDSKKCWSYRDPDRNVQGSFSFAQLRMWKVYFPSDLKIWSYYGNVKETILLHSALKRRTRDAGYISLQL
nr:nucleotide-binding alpha-beta plait domain-containing protein [Tanacetum cinerariifolium]